VETREIRLPGATGRTAKFPLPTKLAGNDWFRIAHASQTPTAVRSSAYPFTLTWLSAR
jgi:hypothetical protein